MPIDGSDELSTAIMELDSAQLIYTVPTLLDLPPVQKEVIKSICLLRASQLGIEPAIKKIIATVEREAKLKANADKRMLAVEFNGDTTAYMELDSKGDPKNISANYLSVMHSDEAFGSIGTSFERYSSIRFNELGNYAEVQLEETNFDGTVTLRKKRWDDSDEAKSRSYIERQYGLYSVQKHDDALRILFQERSYNPVKEILENLVWDGEERCEKFLTKYALAGDTPYIRECSRLIFAGGIWRMMMPGCKMDDVVILIGKQGGGKSTLARFLAIHDDYFGEIKSIEGKEAIEQLDGKWICEIAELAALTKAKEVEAIKAFITRQKDNYRKPYDRNVDDRPRRCIFIGTTNLTAPLLDATGGRRFYPVQTYCDGYDLYRHEGECREYIMQCWAEALAKYRKGEMPNYANESLVSEYRAMQENAMQDDWRIGAIEGYLDNLPIGAFVCIKQLMDDVVYEGVENKPNPTAKDSKDLAIIMDKMKGWEKANQKRRVAKYGQQRGWIKVGEMDIPANPDEDELPL